MGDIYEINLKQSKESDSELNPLKRTAYIFDPMNMGLPFIHTQLPLSYDGPADEGKSRFYTPEHLMLASISSCFFTTFAVVSKNSNLDYAKLAIKSKGIMDNTTGINIMAKINQEIELIIPPLVSEKRALRVLKLTERKCPMGNSIKAEIINKYTVIKQPTP